MADALGTASAAAESRTHPFEFHGTAGEFFRIWIVNLLLTLATLGIYSAWAKVRTQRYFARSTVVAGSSFDYLADPLSILKGRLLVVGFLVGTQILSAIAPLLEVVAFAAIVLLIPWALVRSMAFRAHNTAWRNLRFHFRATYGSAFTAYLLLPVVGVFTLGLFYPYAIYAQRLFVVDHAAFGTTRFKMASTARDFYRAFLRALGLIFGLSLVVGLVVGLIRNVGPEAEWVTVLVPMLVLPLYFYLFGYMAAAITNLTYEGTRFGPHRLSADLPPLGIAWIYATNAIAMLFSLGLLIPWAQVRLARYRFEHIRLHATGDLDAFVAAQSEEVASLGSEFGDALDLDLGL